MNENQILTAWEEASAHLQYQPNPPQRILMVEDDGDTRCLSTEVLIRFGYRVDAASDGAAAWAALEAGNYDLLITDNRMLNLTGVEPHKKLRSARTALPVIMVTGVLSTHEFDESPRLIPDATLLKPYTVAELLATVQAVLSATDSVAAPVPHGQSQPF